MSESSPAYVADPQTKLLSYTDTRDMISRSRNIAAQATQILPEFDRARPRASHDLGCALATIAGRLLCDAHEIERKLGGRIADYTSGPMAPHDAAVSRDQLDKLIFDAQAGLSVPDVLGNTHEITERTDPAGRLEALAAACMLYAQHLRAARHAAYRGEANHAAI